MREVVSLDARAPARYVSTRARTEGVDSLAITLSFEEREPLPGRRWIGDKREEACQAVGSRLPL